MTDCTDLNNGVLDEARLVRDLERIRDGAMEGKQWAPAIRAVELLSRNMGLWKNDGPARTSLADLINRAAASLDDSGTAH